MTDAKIIEHPAIRLVCSSCGTTAGCNCGAITIPRAAYEAAHKERIAEAVRQNPEKSDRAIAAETGAHRNTVVKARKQLVHGVPVAKRTGRDGKQRRAPKARYSGFAIAHDEGYLVSRSTGAATAKFTARVAAEFPGIEVHNPEHELRLREVCRQWVLERECKVDPARGVEEGLVVREQVKEGAREKFDRLLERAKQIEIVRLRAQYRVELDAAIELAVANERAALKAQLARAAEYESEARLEREAAAVALAGVETHMTQAEFALVRACLHPDKPERSVDQLTRAFNIFNRLERTIALHKGVAYLREKKWNIVNPFRRGGK